MRAGFLAAIALAWVSPSAGGQVSASGFEQEIVGTALSVIGAQVDGASGDVTSAGNADQVIRQVRRADGTVLVTVSPR